MALDKKFKLLLLVYNIFLTILGLVIIICNSILLYHLVRYKHFINSDGIIAVVLLILSGLLSCIFSSLGWNVIKKGKKVSVILFGILQLLMMSCCIGFCIWILAISDRLNLFMNRNFDSIFKLATEKEDTSSVLIWDKIQSELSCCGVVGPNDYRRSQSVPMSCTNGGFISIHQQGCLLILHGFIRRILGYSALSSFGMSLYQLLGAIGYFYYSKVETPPPVARRQNSTPTTTTARGSVSKSLLSSSSHKY